MIPSSSKRPGGREAAAAVALAFFGLLVGIGPALHGGLFPSQDGPAHLSTAMTLAGLASDTTGFFSRYFMVRPGPHTVQILDPLMIGVGHLGLGLDPELGAWLVIFGSFTGVVVVNLLLLRPAALAFAPLFFMVMSGCLSTLGFMNFLIGMTLFTQAIFLIRFELTRSSPVRVFALLLVAGATYLAHPLAGLALGAVSGAVAIGAPLFGRLTDRPSPSSTESARLPLSPAVPVACGLVCILLLAMATSDALPQVVRFFADVRQGLSTSHALAELGLLARLLKVLSLSYFVSYSAADFAFSGMFGLALGWLAWRRWRGRRVLPWAKSDSLLCGVLALFCLATLVPRTFELFLSERMTGCMLLVVVVWFAAANFDRRTCRLVLAAGLALNAGFLVWRVSWTMTIDAVLAEYASIGAVLPENASLITLQGQAPPEQRNCTVVQRQRMPCRFEPTRHFAGRVVAMRRIALLTDYQLRPTAGPFPLVLREPWSEYTGYIGTFEQWPNKASSSRDAEIVSDVARLLERTPADVVVTWDDHAIVGEPDRRFQNATDVVLKGYRKIFETRPRGAGAVYLRR